MSRDESTDKGAGKGGSRPPRTRIDLRRSLPARWRYAVALLIVGVVVAGAWWVGRDRPVPEWIGGTLVPALGWVYLLLLAVVLLRWLQRRRRTRPDDDRPRDPPH